MTSRLDAVLAQIRACRICESELADGVRPVLRIRRTAKILIAGQAPGKRVHSSGISYDDRSGDRLREWLGITARSFTTKTVSPLFPWDSVFPATLRMAPTSRRARNACGNGMTACSRQDRNSP